MSLLKVSSILLVGIIFLITSPLLIATERAGTLMVIVNFVNHSYSIEKAWVIKQDYPPFSPYGSTSGELVFQLADFSNNEILKVRVRNPRIIRIPLMPQGSIGNSGESKIEHEKYVEKGNFLLRFPYYKNVRYVNLLGSSPVEVKSGRSSTPPKKNEKVILQMDLFNHLND